MKISGWGRYPLTEAVISTPFEEVECADAVFRSSQSIIPRGLGRSYGDSSLGSNVLCTRRLNYFRSFDNASGLLECDAGVSIGEIVDLFVPRGWFLAVTPGTQYVTVGGALASDVHGKNHHIEGSFSEFVLDFRVLLGNGMVVTASRNENSDLFIATCGGMGLTGMILSVRFYLKRIHSSLIAQTTIKARNLSETLYLFDENKCASYSVAWIDCLAKGKSLGRSHVILGEHVCNNNFSITTSNPIHIPFKLPFNVLNAYTIRLFNNFYYHRKIKSYSHTLCNLKSFYYPLDKITNWNRLYGPRGFIQYQCVIPEICGEIGIKSILDLVSNAGQGSFLAVLKALGPKNKNHLSFPMKGYTLALDFNWNPDVMNLLDRLDGTLRDFGGRLYLAKDSRMSKEFFRESYPEIDDFEAVREKYFAVGKFNSLQSIRLGIQ